MYGKSKTSVFGMVALISLFLAACGSQGSASAPTPTHFADLFEAGVDWMDHLKTCTPYVQTMKHPFLKGDQVNTIKGMNGDFCETTMETPGVAVISCKLDAEGVHTLTREELYEQMASKTISASTEDPSALVYASQCETRLLLGTPTSQ
jgi:hypothetical protein